MDRKQCILISITHTSQTVPWGGLVECYLVYIFNKNREVDKVARQESLEQNSTRGPGQNPGRDLLKLLVVCMLNVSYLM